MNKIRHEVRQEKFRKIEEAIKAPDYLRKFIAKIVGETAYLLEKDLKFSPEQTQTARKGLPPALSEAIRDVKPPTGWRKKALILKHKTSLKEIHPKSFIEGDGAFNFGKLMGLAGDLDHVRQSPDTTPEMNDLIDDITLPLLIREEDVPKLIKGTEFIQKAVEEVPTLSLAKQKSYYSGRSAGVNGIFNDELKFTHGYSSTEIYDILLLLDEYLDCLNTRKQLHQFIVFILGEKGAGKFSTFEKLCEYIGYLTPSQIRKRKKAQGKPQRRAF